MNSFIGLVVKSPLCNKLLYKQALQEIRHYLSFQKNVEVNQSQYLIAISCQKSSLTLVKHIDYLHSGYVHLPIINELDFQFFVVCYECLMIVQEHFPSRIGIEILSDGDSKQLQSFQHQKKEQFGRRVNSNLKSISEQNTMLKKEEIQDIIYLMNKEYSKKSKIIALKLLNSNRNPTENYDFLTQNQIETIQNFAQDIELKRLALQFLEKIKQNNKFIKNSERSNENLMRNSNVFEQKFEQPFKIKGNLFQMKQSVKLQRVCFLIGSLLKSEISKQNYPKVDTTINLVTNKFVNSEYEQQTLFATDFMQLVGAYWLKRGKNIDETLGKKLQQKIKQIQADLSQRKNRQHTSPVHNFEK